MTIYDYAALDIHPMDVALHVGDVVIDTDGHRVELVNLRPNGLWIGQSLVHGRFFVMRQNPDNGSIQYLVTPS